MHNVETKIAGSKLVITVDIGKEAVNAAPPSSTGKTRLVASTSGAMSIASPIPGLSFSLNVTAKPQAVA